MDNQADIEAERWFARLQAPDCGVAERVAFEQWHSAHPDHEAAYARVEHLIGRVTELRDDPEIARAMRDALRPAPARRPWHVQVWGSVAASVVLGMVGAGVGVSYFRTQAPHSASFVHYATGIGEQRSVRLADGTTVRLDTDTQLDVSDTPGERRVRQLRGRAQYEVVHNARRAFVVTTLGGTTTDIGTEFQIGIQDKTATVTLLEGKVTVMDAAPHPHSVALEPGEQLTYDAAGTVWTKSKADIEAAKGWVEGKLVFRDELLSDVVRVVNLYSSSKLRIADPAIANFRVSGTFKADDQESLLLALQAIWSIKSQTLSGGEILLSRQNSP